jgi:hypothetical protein
MMEFCTQAETRCALVLYNNKTQNAVAINAFSLYAHPCKFVWEIQQMENTQATSSLSKTSVHIYQYTRRHIPYHFTSSFTTLCKCEDNSWRCDLAAEDNRAA